jgi:hypothetical protein
MEKVQWGATTGVVSSFFFRNHMSFAQELICCAKKPHENSLDQEAQRPATQGVVGSYFVPVWYSCVGISILHEFGQCDQSSEKYSGQLHEV